VRSGDRIWNPDAFGLMRLGADVQSIMNHPLLSPEDMSISSLGNFSMQVNPTTLKPEIASVAPNPEFGRLISSFSQDGVESRRTIRLRLRIIFYSVTLTHGLARASEPRPRRSGLSQNEIAAFASHGLRHVRGRDRCTVNENRTRSALGGAITPPAIEGRR
jgi:hypothetical protein